MRKTNYIHQFHNFLSMYILLQIKSICLNVCLEDSVQLKSTLIPDSGRPETDLTISIYNTALISGQLTKDKTYVPSSQTSPIATKIVQLYFTCHSRVTEPKFLLNHLQDRTSRCRYTDGLLLYLPMKLSRVHEQLLHCVEGGLHRVSRNQM